MRKVNEMAMRIFEIYERCFYSNCGDTHTIILSGSDNVLNRLKEIILNDKEIHYSPDYSRTLFELMDKQDFSKEFTAQNKDFRISYEMADKDYIVQLQEGN